MRKEHSLSRAGRRICPARLRWLILWCAVAALLGACSSRPTPDTLAQTLPERVGGEVTTITTPPANTLNGLATDDTLAALGKSREDSSIAYAVAPPDLLVVAIAVDGVDGPTLLGALASKWPPGGDAITDTVGGKQVLLLDGASDVYFYKYGDTAYIVETADLAVAEEVLSQLP